MQIVVDQLLTSYELTGKGGLVLLLHGWGDNSQTFKALAERLSKKHQVLTLDLPGFGATEAPKTTWSLDNYAEFLKTFLDKLKLEPKAVIGHSNGGALAIRALSTGQLKTGKLVLLAASGVRSNNKAKRFTLKVIAKTGNVATIWMPERYRRDLRKSLYGAAGSDMLVAPHLQETFKQTVRQDVQGDAAGLDVPTLLVFAADDKAVPVADGKQYHDLIGGSKLEVIPDAGHFVHHDQPEKVAKLIEDFLDG